MFSLSSSEGFRLGSCDYIRIFNDVNWFTYVIDVVTCIQRKLTVMIIAPKLSNFAGKNLVSEESNLVPISIFCNAFVMFLEVLGSSFVDLIIAFVRQHITNETARSFR